MSEPEGRSSAQDHEFVVERVRDITKGEEIVIESRGGVDTAIRIIFPTSWDRIIEHPESTTTGEDE
ncbi:hypothetical protein Aple_053610 [Acrocarpospora pleiomorpha]|uniref:Uncharacterized protein n=1 Tax=Acrocarpospora pleiomorpha TaxID=90975 RepID=A0A5M3XMJ3_9ACTN|nr:hypothetical protein [Acrocarpospora pleiomorpha]GES22464.1 hypothetical protein Aple_053610 [Acrocarpospora pleiomorpha]